jgi:hypothetical protein
MVLQNCMDFLKIEPGSISETCPTSSYDGNQIIDIKVEEASDTQEVEDPLLITLPEIKAEHEVSCVSVCLLLGTFHRYPELCIVFLIFLCLYVNMKHHQSGEWILKSSLENVSGVLYFVAHLMCSTNSILSWVTLMMNEIKY